MNRLCRVGMRRKISRSLIFAVLLILLLANQSLAMNYLIQDETDADITVTGGTSELTYFGYPTFSDLRANTNANAFLSLIDVPAGMSSTGLTFSQEGSGPGPNPIPEPTTFLLLGSGLLGLAGYRWHQRRRAGAQTP